MKLRKYQHACLVLEKEKSVIIIDPGTFSHDFIMPKHVDAVIVTHNHQDHLNPELVKSILATHKEARLIAHESIVADYADYQTIAATPGSEHTAGNFSVKFFGGVHATIIAGQPTPANLSILVDDLYYPGDSFFVPQGISIQTLALPVSAPWLRINDTVSFLAAVKPHFTFPTHDAILSTDGKQIVDNIVGSAAAAQGIIYKRLDETVIEL